MNKDPFIDLLTETTLYRPQLTVLIGSVKAALILSQIMYWQRVMDDLEPDHAGPVWWYKTDKQWMDEMRFTITELKNSRKLLIDLGYVKVMRKGVPAKNFYQLQSTALKKALIGLDSSIQVSSIDPIQLVGNLSTITETTTETTTENIPLLKTSFSEEKSKTIPGIKPGKKLKKGSVTMGAEEVLEDFKQAESIEEIIADIKSKKKKTYTASLLAEYWKRVYRYYYPKLPAHDEISYGKQARLRNIFQKIDGIDILESLAIIMGNWQGFIKHCDVAHGVKKPTEYPTIVFLEKARMGIVTFCSEYKKGLEEPEIHLPKGMEQFADDFK